MAVYPDVRTLKKELIVWFQLETDSAILLTKAKEALKTYKHQVFVMCIRLHMLPVKTDRQNLQVVVANLLETRKREVTLVTPNDVQHIRINTESDDVEIEQQIVCELKTRHEIFQTQPKNELR